MNNYLVVKHIHIMFNDSSLPFLIELEFKLENRTSWRKTSQGNNKHNHI